MVVYEGVRQRREQERSARKPKRKAERMQQAQERWEAEQRLWLKGAAAGEPLFDAEADTAAAVAELAAADVVLTQYQVLQQECRLQPGAAGGRALRHAKRYRVAASPLAALAWWRCVLDEAQHVGAGLGLVAEMAGRLRGANRWVVSGTPLGAGGLGDLQALLAVLRHEPFADAAAWRAVVQGPVGRGEAAGRAALAALLAQVAWRNDKASVAGELGLPPRALQARAPRPARWPACTARA